jgi:predicted GIY-YIG superfamily endonuclease
MSPPLDREVKMKDVIDMLYREAKHHRAEAKKYEAAVKALQAVCKHKFVEDGHDSHNTYKRCTICGLRR